jgi:hypothetical protein
LWRTQAESLVLRWTRADADSGIGQLEARRALLVRVMGEGHTLLTI